MANIRRMMSKHAQITCKVMENMIFHHHSSARVSLAVPKHYELLLLTIRVTKERISALEKILEMLDNEVAETSPVQKFTIMDSPPSLLDFDGVSHVDQQADEFIHRFYARLRLQM
ncbi:hypothetical protein ACHQM5_002046 [Ranunculus cassubicifolius]